jgi:hypothetical protein
MNNVCHETVEVWIRNFFFHHHLVYFLPHPTLNICVSSQQHIMAFLTDQRNDYYLFQLEL